MKTTQIIVGTVVVIAATVICGTEGIPRPQDYFEVDGFAFDGPVDGSTPSSRTENPSIVVPTFTAPPGTPGIIPLTGTQSPMTHSPEVAECIQNCRFRVTSEYNPVCGTDRTVYSNPGMLNCAKICGLDVNQAYSGPCSSLVRG